MAKEETLLIEFMEHRATGLANLAQQVFKKVTTVTHSGPDDPFGWEMATTQMEGMPRSRAYGKNMHFGNIVAAWTELFNAYREVLYLIIDHGDGPTKGIGSGQVYVDDQPVEQFTSVAIQERLGTMDQLHMTGFEKLKKEYKLDKELLEPDGYFTWTTPNDFFDDLEFTFYFPDGLSMKDRLHGAGMVAVLFLCQISEHGEDNWTTFYESSEEALSLPGYYAAYSLSELGFNCERGKRYDLRFKRQTAGYEPAEGASDSVLRSIREVYNVAFRRPGKALLGIRAMTSTMLSDSINVKVLREDRIINTFDGVSWTLKLSNNRAWVVWDVLTQPVIVGNGAGIPYDVARHEGLDPSELDVEFFYKWSLFCDEEIPSGYDGAGEHRCDCDIVCGTITDVFTLACKLALVGRARLYWEGRKITGWIDDKVAGPVDLVIMDTAMANSWKNKWVFADDLAGVIDVAYKDSLQDYADVTVPYPHSDSGNYKTTKTVHGYGLTTRGTALHFGRYLLERDRLVRNRNEFTAFKEAFNYRLGDVIRLQCKPANWGEGYRVVDCQADNTVQLDRSLSDVSIGDVLYVRCYDEENKEIAINNYIVESTARILNCTAHWKLDDDLPTTTVVDSSGRDHAGVLQGDDNTEDLSTLDSKIANALHFNGIDDRVYVPAFSLTTSDTDRSIAFWVKAPAGQVETNPGFFNAGYNLYTYTNDHGNPGSDTWFGIYDGGTSGGVQISNDLIWTDTWHHIAIVVNRTTQKIKFYLDSVLIATDEDISDVGDSSDPTRYFLLGSRSTIIHFCDCILDDFACYSKALTQEEITQIFNNGNVGTLLGIEGTWSTRPSRNSVVAIGKADDIKLRRVVGLVNEQTNYTKVTVETYDEALFDADDEIPQHPLANYVAPGALPSLNRPITRAELESTILTVLPKQLDTETPMWSNLTWTGDTVDTVGWEKTDPTEPILFRYRGVTYEITPDDTTLKFIYWDPASPTVFLVTATNTVALASGCWLMCINDDGVAMPANAIQLLHAGVLQAGTITAAYGQIANLTVDTLQIQDDAVTVVVAAESAASEYLDPSPVGTDGYGLHRVAIQSPSIVATGAPILTSFNCTIDGHLLTAARLQHTSLFKSDYDHTVHTISNVALVGTNNVIITTSSAHGLSSDDHVWMWGLGGIVELINAICKITVTGANTFTLQDTRSDWFTAWTTGGSVWWTSRWNVNFATCPALGYAIGHVQTIDESPDIGTNYMYAGTVRNFDTYLYSFVLDHAVITATEIKK